MNTYVSKVFSNSFEVGYCKPFTKYEYDITSVKWHKAIATIEKLPTNHMITGGSVCT